VHQSRVNVGDIVTTLDGMEAQFICGFAENYLMAPESGIFEVIVDLGAWARAGQAIGQIHFLERPDRQPEVITAKTDGYLMVYRAPCLTQQGDCLAVIADPVDPRSLL
jgi:N2-acetyl-L-2,4-diaminobutanoate deacetylase